jgi:hypothetical protein
MQWAFLRAAGRTETGCRLQLEPTGQPVTAAPSTEAGIRVAFKAKHQAIPLPLRGRWDCCLHRQTLYLVLVTKETGNCLMKLSRGVTFGTFSGRICAMLLGCPGPAAQALGGRKGKNAAMFAILLRKQTACNPIRVCAALLVAATEIACLTV